MRFVLIFIVILLLVPIPTFFTNQPIAFDLLSQTHQTLVQTLRITPLGSFCDLSCLVHQPDEQAILVDATLTEPQ